MFSYAVSKMCKCYLRGLTLELSSSVKKKKKKKSIEDQLGKKERLKMKEENCFLIQIEKERRGSYFRGNKFISNCDAVS